MINGHFSSSLNCTLINQRVVFMNQLKSGLLLVTGPFKLNGCPLRRINAKYVIATSTKIDISKVTMPENVDDAFFNRIKEKKQKPTDGEIFEVKKEVRFYELATEYDFL